jgi:uncharacterized protein (DUF58 family)
MPGNDHTPPAYARLLNPDALSKIHRLQLLARGMVSGSISGRHRSPYRGFSVEFAEHREYAPGDNIRDLDWRVLARSDRYYIKQYIEETNLRATILLDASGSMRYAGDASARYQGRRLSKFDYARLLAASLMHLLIHQQDAVGLVTFDSVVRRYLPARMRPSYLRVMLEAICATEPERDTALAPIFHNIAERIQRRGMVIILSDCFDDPDLFLKALHHFRFRKHEVIVFQIMAEEEINFPFNRWSLFRDLEPSDQQIEIDPLAIRAAYLDEVRNFQQQLHRECGRMNIDYVPVSTKQDFSHALSGYLARRQSLLRK